MRSLPRGWRPALAGIGILVLALALCEALGWPFLRLPLERQLSQKLQREVALDGKFRLRLLGGVRVFSERFSIAAPPWETAAGGRPFVAARDATLALPYASVFGRPDGDGSLHIDLLEVDHIDARLVRDSAGRANWQFEFQKEENQAAPGSGALTPEFRRLVVRRGRLGVRDAVARLALDATASTAEGSAGTPRGLRVSAQGEYRDQPFRATASAPGILPLLAPRGRSGPVALALDVQLPRAAGVDGKLRFDGQAQDLLRLEGLSGRFRVSADSLARVAGLLQVTLPTTAPFSMAGTIAKSGRRWDVQVQAFDVARTHLSGQFRYDTAPARPLLSGRLRGRQLVLEDLAPAFGASPAGAGSARDAPAVPAGRRVLPQREFDIPALHRMDADVDVRLDRVDLGSATLKPLEPLQGRLRLARGVLTLEDLLARTADGELRGRIGLDARPAQPLWSAELKWSGIRLAQWLTLRNRFARESEKLPVGKEAEQKADPPFVRGEPAGQANLLGRGRSTARMLSSLDGTVQLWVRDGAVSQLLVEALGLDVAESLGLILRGDRDIPLACAAVSLKARDGVLQTEAGLVDTPDSLILVTGQVSLADERFDLTLAAKPRDRSLASVRAPIHLRGRFAEPRLRPDIEKLGRKAAAAAALGTLLAPLAALLALADPGASTAGEGCAATLARLQQNPATPPALKRALRRGG